MLRVFVVVAGLVLAPGPAGRKHTIEIRGFAYKPVALTVARGDTVVFVNKDVVPHTATAPRQQWDTSTIAAGASATIVADKPGDYDYVCALHPSMKATLKVR